MSTPTAAGGTKRREAFSGRSVFVFAAIGSAVGLGNIWRFPFVAFESGGGAFLIPYLVALLSAGIPLLFFDYAIGHRYRGSAPLSFRRISRYAEPIGWIQVLVAFVIASTMRRSSAGPPATRGSLWTNGWVKTTRRRPASSPRTSSGPAAGSASTSSRHHRRPGGLGADADHPPGRRPEGASDGPPCSSSRSWWSCVRGPGDPLTVPARRTGRSQHVLHARVVGLVGRGVNNSPTARSSSLSVRLRHHGDHSVTSSASPTLTSRPRGGLSNSAFEVLAGIGVFATLVPGLLRRRRRMGRRQRRPGLAFIAFPADLADAGRRDLGRSVLHCLILAA